MTGSRGGAPGLLLNLAGLQVAGGRSVAINLLRAWDAAGLDMELTVVGPEGAGYGLEMPRGGRWIPLRGWRSRGWARPWVDTFTLPAIIRAVVPDVVLTLSNMACRLPAGSEAVQALLVMWPYAMYEDAEIWDRIPPRQQIGKRLRRAYLKWTARRADVVIAQTEAARERLLARLPVERTVVIPTAVSLPARVGDDDPAPTPAALGRHSWLCVSRYYSHKNLETLVDVARVLKRRGRSSRIILTIEARHGERAAALLREIERHGLGSHVTSIGEVDIDAVRALYAGAFGVVLPTLLESYSQVFVEALGYGRPLVTSDRDFARSVCGDAPVYVDPLDPEAIADAMCRLEDDGEFRRTHVAAGLAWAASQPSWHETGRRYAELCRTLSAGADAAAPRELEG